MNAWQQPDMPAYLSAAIWRGRKSEPTVPHDFTKRSVVAFHLRRLSYRGRFCGTFRFFSASPVKPASEEAGWLRSTLGRYVDFMYLSHGYAFFAPNPGPSHLLECEIKSSAIVQNTGNETKRQPASNTLRELSLVAQPEESFSTKAVRWRVFPDRQRRSTSIVVPSLLHAYPVLPYFICPGFPFR